MTVVGFSWVAPVRVAALTRAFLLGDGEPAACGLLDEALVNIGHDLFECGAVESLAENRSPADDVLSSFHLFDVAVQHLSFDFISQGFGFSLGFFDQGFQILQGFNLRGDFDGRNIVFSFMFSFGGIANPQVIFKSCRRGFRFTRIWA